MVPEDAARQLLPLWVVWGPAVFYLPLAFGLGGLAARLAVLVGGRPAALPAGLHWAERARRTFSTRVALLLTLFVVPLLLATFALAFAGRLLPLGGAGLGAAALVLAAAAILAVRSRVEDEVLGRRLGPVARLRGLLAPALLLFPHLLLLLLTAPLYGDRFDLRFALILGGALAALPFASRLGTGLARLLGVVRPAPERLARIVAEVAAAMGVEPRETLLVVWPSANAVAFPGSGRLAFSDRALEVLSDDEVAAVAAHELGHLTEPRAALAGRLAAAALLLPLGAVRPVGATFGPLVAALFALALLLAFLAARPLFRRFEERADRLAAGHERRAGDFARALERLHEANAVPAVLGPGQTHPHLYDRLLAAGLEPAYPRPAPPSRGRQLAAPGLAVLSVLLVVAALRLGVVFVSAFATEPRQLELAMALGGASAGDLTDVGVLLEERGDLEAAARWLEAATALGAEGAEAPARHAATLARLGRCEEAARAAATARSRLGEPPDPLDVEDLDAASAWLDLCRAGGGRGPGPGAP